MTKTFAVKTKVWLYPGMAGWHFVTIPKKTTEEIDFYFKDVKRGWGSLPVIVTIGTTEWKTSIFPDKQTQSYILPVKAAIRKQEAISQGDTISLALLIER